MIYKRDVFSLRMLGFTITAFIYSLAHTQMLLIL